MHNFSIMLVDDDKTNLIGVSKNLRYEGFPVKALDSGENAIEELKQKSYDLVITDLIMDQVNGIDVLREARRLHPDIMVIILTGRGSVSTAIDALRMKADDYMLKPCESEEMIFRIKLCMDKKRHLQEKRLIKKALAESEERFSYVLDNLLIGILIFNEKTILYCNTEYLRIFEFEHDRQRINFLDLISLKDKILFDNEYRNLLAGDSLSMEMDFRIRLTGSSKQSRYRWIHLRGSMIEYDNRKSLLLNIVDATKAQELEHLVRIEDKMSSLGRISAGMAHEIRNPLSGINVYLDAIKENFENPHNANEIKDILKQTQKAANRIELVLKRILDFSKPTLPNLTLVNINDILLSAIDLSEVMLNKYDIFLVKKMKEHLPDLYMEPVMIEQVIVNIFSNSADAVKKMPSRRIIGVATDLYNDGVVVKIGDSGRGIPFEDREKIFDPFYTTKNDGSGIGLSICHRIISDHHGTIDVSDSEYGGTEVIIHIPVIKNCNTN